MSKETQTKQCPCCTENPEGLMFWTGNGWHCTVCSYTEPETDLELDDYQSVTPKKSHTIKVNLIYRGKGKPLAYGE